MVRVKSCPKGKRRTEGEKGKEELLHLRISDYSQLLNPGVEPKAIEVDPLASTDMAAVRLS